MYLAHDAITVSDLIDGVASPDRGGVAVFVGLVRNHHAGRHVVRLEYHVYGPMAESECARIVTEAEGKWPCRVALRHRVGMLPVGEVAVAVVVAAAHRGSAFDACRYVIEELKRRAPIWKREFYADGTEAWVDPTAPQGTQPVPSEHTLS